MSRPFATRWAQVGSGQDMGLRCNRSWQLSGNQTQSLFDGILWDLLEEVFFLEAFGAVVTRVHRRE